MSTEAGGLKEGFRSIYQVDDGTEAQRRLDMSCSPLRTPGRPRSMRLGERDPFLEAEEAPRILDEPTTNGYAEGVVSKGEGHQRRAYGLPTFAGFRTRVVIGCG